MRLVSLLVNNNKVVLLRYMGWFRDSFEIVIWVKLLVFKDKLGVV